MVLLAACRADARTNDAHDHKQDKPHKDGLVEVIVGIAVCHCPVPGVYYHTAAWAVVW
uniref:Uncharacterized protein n=1 Tax=viral metagenome TaxID=1070528 RepID=A0A6C0JI92_9ZZZZ